MKIVILRPPLVIGKVDTRFHFLSKKLPSGRFDIGLQKSFTLLKAFTELYLKSIIKDKVVHC